MAGGGRTREGKEGLGFDSRCGGSAVIPLQPFPAMPIVHITRRERFSAAHKLGRQEWSAEKNMDVFGKCANPNWHGHNYELWVTVQGDIDPETGFVVDLSALSRLIHRHVIDAVDHKNLNVDVPFLQGKGTTTEQLAVAFWQQLEGPVAEIGGRLHSVKVQETENNSVEYFGH